MVDITDKLIQQSQRSVARAKPMEQNQFLPEIPSSKVDIALPAEVLNSLQSTQKVSQTSINNERRRINETADAVKKANVEIDSANRQMQETRGNVLLEFAGMFDNDYNYQYQKGRISTAQNSLKVKAAELDLERQSEALDLKESSLASDIYKQQMAFQTQRANLSAQQANAIVTSNAARKAYRKQLQDTFTHEEILQVEKTGSYDAVWPAQEVKQYLNDVAVFNLDLEAKQLANASGRTDLANKLESRALSQLPINWGNSLLAQAEKDKTSLIKISKDVTVPASKLKDAMATKMKLQNDAFTTASEQQLKLVKNDADMSAMLSNVSNVSSIFSGDGSNLTNLGRLNLLNITEETIADFPIESIHPSLRADFQTVLSAGSILNEKSQPTKDSSGKVTAPPAGVSTQDIFTFRQTVLDLNAKSEKLQTDMVEAVPDKGSKAGLKEWFANGRMQTQTNSASMLVANSISMPNLGNDQALQASYQVMLENIAKGIKGEDINLVDATPEEKTRLVFEALLQDNFKGKESSRDAILKALNTKNSKGLYPVEAYASNRIGEILAISMNKLGDAHPEYKNYFDTLKLKTGFANPASLAQNLAELSFRLQKQNPDLPDLSLNNELLDIVNGYMHSKETQWDSQLNPVRGSLMNLMFNGNPSRYINDSINTVIGSPSRAAWTTLQEPSFAEQRKISQQQYKEFLQSEPTTRPETNVFGNVPLPIK